MDWKDKIKKGMTLITEGCQEQGNWAQCWECPFKEYCDVIEKKYETPDYWD